MKYTDPFYIFDNSSCCVLFYKDGYKYYCLDNRHGEAMLVDAYLNNNVKEISLAGLLQIIEYESNYPWFNSNKNRREKQYERYKEALIWLIQKT